MGKGLRQELGKGLRQELGKGLEQEGKKVSFQAPMRPMELPTDWRKRQRREEQRSGEQRIRRVMPNREKGFGWSSR